MIFITLVVENLKLYVNNKITKFSTFVIATNNILQLFINSSIILLLNIVNNSKFTIVFANSVQTTTILKNSIEFIISN